MDGTRIYIPRQLRCWVDNNFQVTNYLSNAPIFKTNYVKRFMNSSMKVKRYILNTLSIWLYTAYLVSVCPDWDAKRSGQSEVGQLDVALGVDEKILRLQITMKNSVRMTERNTLQ